MLVTNITKTWAMPNRKTFKIKPIQNLIGRYRSIVGQNVDIIPEEPYLVIDPFANEASIKILFLDKRFRYISNDLDVQYSCDYHLDALEFLSKFPDSSVSLVLYDPPYCYDDKTEVMTQYGWKLFKNVTPFDEIMCLNDNNEIEYHPYNSRFEQYYKGKIVSVDNHLISLHVTKEHKCWGKVAPNTNYEFIEAQFLKKYERVWFRKGNTNWKGTNFSDNFILPRVDFLRKNRYGESYKPDKYIPWEIWLPFFGFWLAEGNIEHTMHWRVNSKGERYSTPRRAVRLTQKKPEVQKWVHKVLKNLGYKYNLSGITFAFEDTQMWTYLNQFGKSHEKYIPQEIKNLPPRYLQILLDAMILGDGYNKTCKHTKTGRYYQKKVYYTNSVRLMNDVCEIAIKLGYGIGVQLTPKTYRGKVCLPVYSISLLSTKEYPVINHQIQEEFYDGMIYCLDVPYHRLFVKRNGRCYWCGNSFRQVSECYKKLGRTVSATDTSNKTFGDFKKEIARVTKKDGYVISCMWNSNGIGSSLGFKQVEILLVAHGSMHNDTIITVEQKI